MFFNSRHCHARLSYAAASRLDLETVLSSLFGEVSDLDLAGLVFCSTHTLGW
jgi:hypothetical protein